MSDAAITPDMVKAGWTVARRIKDGARLRGLRLVDPATPDEGLVVHLTDGEAAELTEALGGILAKRLAV